MPTTLTLKNVPDALYERLKISAEMHRRSLNFEAIVCLEEVLLPTRVTPTERLARARAIAAALAPGKFEPQDIDNFKRAGRK
jgi:antitoxin FitA